MGARPKRPKRGKGQAFRRSVQGFLLLPLMLLSTFYGFCALCLLAFNFVPPPVTGVQIQRRIESFFEDQPYEKRYRPVFSLDKISDHLEHAVVAAEDGRFYEHYGIDWKAVQQAMEDNRRRRRPRGASTITQQLVKNLFLTTHSNYLRKGLEVPLTFMAELLLSKERILYLYLNVIEWGRGVYGAEAAAQHYYGTSAERLSRHQAASLAAVIPNPRQRTPKRVGWYTSIILSRMNQMGW